MAEDLMQPRSFEIDLDRVTGSAPAKVFGYVTNEFGDPSFKMTRIVMQDGKSYYCEGEHDYPYLTDLDEEKLREFGDKTE